MKLFIQIPCFNEEETLPLVVSDLPRKIEGIDEIYTLIIDDGSTDNTVEVAKRLGIDYVVKNGRNLGLAASYGRGIEACLFLGADIIVNTDGDNQYQGADIDKLVKPILDKHCDIVVGCRNINEQSEFPWIKKVLQRLGSRVVRHLSKADADVPDAPSGFRAVSRMAAIRLSVMNGFSYTIEMLIGGLTCEVQHKRCGSC
ncbi:MAG: glycosyltransferase family 2 protein [Planctomycetota bacterium]